MMNDRSRQNQIIEDDHDHEEQKSEDLATIVDEKDIERKL
jgi:hypothetical protein